MSEHLRLDFGNDWLIHEITTPEFLKRLSGFARSRLFRYGRFANCLGTVDDYVQEAVRRVLEGKRRFVPGTDTSAFGMMCGTIDSLISHDREKLSRRGPELGIGGERGKDDAALVAEEAIASDEDLESRVVVRDDIERFIRSLEPDLQRYIRLRAGGGALQTAEDFATALGTSVNVVRNMDRRLRRRRLTWSKQ